MEKFPYITCRFVVVNYAGFNNCRKLEVNMKI